MCVTGSIHLLWLCYACEGNVRRCVGGWYAVCMSVCARCESLLYLGSHVIHVCYVCDNVFCVSMLHVGVWYVYERVLGVTACCVCLGSHVIRVCYICDVFSVCCMWECRMWCVRMCGVCVCVCSRLRMEESNEHRGLKWMRTLGQTMKTPNATL